MVDGNLTKIHLYLAKCLLDCIEDEDLRNIQILLSEKNANPNIILPNEGGSPLHLAIAYGQNDTFTYDVVKLFLKYGGDPNLRCGEVGLTPVHVAISSGKSKILYLLLKNNGDIFLKDTFDNSALAYANETENLEWITEIALLMNSLKDGGSIQEYLQLMSLSIVNKEEISTIEENSSNNCHQNTFNLFKYDYRKRKKSNEFSPTVGNYDAGNITQQIERLTLNQKFDDTIILDNNSIMTLDETYTKKYDSEEEEAAYKTAESINNDSNIQRNSEVPAVTTTDKQINITFNYSLTEDCSDDDNNLLSKLTTTTLTTQQTDNKRRRNHSIYRNYILSPIPFATNNSTAEQYNHILSPILPLCTANPINNKGGGTTAANTKTLVNVRNDYKTPINYIFYNSKTHRDDKSSLLDKSLESFCLYRNNDAKSDEDISIIHLQSLADYSKTILAMSEEHKLTDTEQGVELIERRYLTKPLVLPTDESGVGPLLSDTNEMTIDLDSDYDSDTLRYNLTQLGYIPGPITHTTKRVYLKKLVELWKFPSRATQSQPQSNQKVYSAELQKTIQDPEWTKNLNDYIQLERQLIEYFENNSEKKLRGGSTKSSFTYLLLDPRITQNLPLRASTMDPTELWKTFISSIFYVGKGKRSRPYAHLYEAVAAWNSQTNKKKNFGKIQQIIDIWQAQQGVICLHVFLNILPVEAHTREAAMIQVIGVQNLQNLKAGEYYGIAMNWRRKEKCLLGVYLLYKAMQIFLHEGERQLRPADID